MRRGASAVLAVLLAAAAVVTGAPPPRADALATPAGFRLVDTATGQPAYNLTTFAWLADGALLTAGKDGTITFVPAGGKPRTLTKVPGVRAVQDHGFLGMALANDYATTGTVYVTYDKGDPDGSGFGMLEQWRATPADAPTSFTKVRTIIDGRSTSPQLTQTARIHAIGTVLVAADDTLWVSLGDDASNNQDPNALRAQDLNGPFGKILHLTADGKGVPSNPFYDAGNPSSWRSRVYAYGFRNPYRFSLDPRSGMPYVGDVGWGKVEEVHTVAPGANAGWPCYEATDRSVFGSYQVCKDLYAAGSAQPPTWSYLHAGSGASVVGGVHYTGESYPDQYRGAWFFGDYTRNTLWTMTTDPAGGLVRAPEAKGFATDAGGPVAFQTGPNGDVTYADILSSKVRRLVYSPGNRAPVAAFTYTVDAATRKVTFTAADSYDLDGDQLTYNWVFGDGSTGTGMTTSRTYTSRDPVNVLLTVTDQVGSKDTATAEVHPGNSSPTLSFTPPPGRTYSVGDTVRLSATASDAEDGALPVTWETTLLHCPYPNSCHRHPDGETTGGAYEEPFTDHGADTSMLVTLRATDSKGAEVSQTYDALPNLRTLAVTSPVAVSINGEVASSVKAVAGSVVQVDAPASSSYWTFAGWSDGGAAQHSLTMPNGDLNLTARYTTAIDARYAELGGAGSFLGKPTSAEYDVAGGRARNYAGGRLYWSAATGAREVHGAILTRYLAGGGPGTFGFPTSDEVAVTGGRAATFTKANIYWSKATGARFTRGQILQSYLAAGGPDAYGLPSSDDTKISGGYRTTFTGNRSIYWSGGTGAHRVYGGILNKYAEVGYQASCLGFPTTDEYAVTGGRRNDFTGGSITYLSATKKATVRC